MQRLVLVIAVACGGSQPVPGPDEVVGPGVDCPGAEPATDRAPDGTPLPAGVQAALAQRWDELGTAQAAGDLARVRSAVCAARAALGPWQGVAEATVEYRAGTGTPDPIALRDAYLTALDAQIAGREPWVGLGDSTSGVPLSEPLRGACKLVRWYLAALPLAGVAQREQLRAAAIAGLDWLVRVQRPEGQFPYPDLADDLAEYLAECRAAGHTDDECMRAAPRALQLHAAGVRAWERAGRPPGVYVDGWLVTDALSDPGGFQFDTGICARALLDGHAVIGDPRYLAGARRAGDYAIRQVAVPNWNYNAFSVELLARLDMVDASRPWAKLALDKARLGVLPGALPGGRWFDPHNARIVYHQLILRALAELASRTSDPWLTVTLAAALDRSVREIESRGAAGLEDGLEAYVVARRDGLDPGRALAIMVQASSPGAGVTNGSLVFWLRDELDQ